jgi:hypothetical protein
MIALLGQEDSDFQFGDFCDPKDRPVLANEFTALFCLGTARRSLAPL